MTEEKNGVTNGPAANAEMAPQEDGTKVPLADGPEVKFTSSNPPNGDAKINLGAAPTFSGLTKEELMKYSDDPFWVRLRWGLFILFWAGWAAMLVMSIVIIVQAPRCTPKETLEWVQESAMMDYDINNQIDADGDGTESPEDMVKMAKELGMKTVYLEDLISHENFEELNLQTYQNKEEEIKAILKAAADNGLHVVTDFVPAEVPIDNVWYANDTLRDQFFVPNTRKLDFSSPELLTALADVLKTSWIPEGVKGFLMSKADTEDQMNATATITKELESSDGFVVYGVVDMQNELTSGFNGKMYRQFLDEHVDADPWSYYKYNPKVAEPIVTDDIVRLVTLSLFLVPGTPILDTSDKAYYDSQKELVMPLSELREHESIQVGNMTFVNGTDEDVIAFVRVMKGTPGFAIALNMGTSSNATIDFTQIDGVADKGETQLYSTKNTTISGIGVEKSELSSVFLEPLEGIVLQFVPSFG